MAARCARNAAIEAVKAGTKDCTIRLAYAPNTNVPLQEIWEMEQSGLKPKNGHFNFDAMLSKTSYVEFQKEIGVGVYGWKLD